ncbi:UPF0481 protein-like protein [Tanacetum coccineum]
MINNVVGKPTTQVTYCVLKLGECGVRFRKRDTTQFLDKVQELNFRDSAKSVGFLHYKGIIEHWLGNDTDIADFFNGLCQQVVADLNGSYLLGLTNSINKNRDNQWSTWKENRHEAQMLSES